MKNIKKLKRRSQALHQLEKQKRFVARQGDPQPLPAITCRFSAEKPPGYLARPSYRRFVLKL